MVDAVSPTYIFFVSLTQSILDISYNYFDDIIPVLGFWVLVILVLFVQVCNRIRGLNKKYICGLHSV